MSTQTNFDVVIIGSGAGGAPIANILAKAGKSVLVLEKGPLIQPQYQDPTGLSGFKRDEMFSTGPEKIIHVPGVANDGESYYGSHVEPDVNDEPHVYRDVNGQDKATIEGYTAQVVGGGTQLYGGVSLRFTPTDLRLASFNAGRTDLRDDPNGDVERESRDWPISYDELEPYYCKAEELVGINGTRENQLKWASVDHYQPPLDPNPISKFAADGFDALGMARYRTPLAVITRDHPPSGRTAGDSRTAFVNRYGDPLGYKSNTWVSLLSPVSQLPNFELRPNCTVTSLESDGGARVTRVNYISAGGESRTVTGNAVVVACSAIESVRLLLLSAEADGNFGGRINGNGLLGTYFLTHCFGGGQAIVPGRFDKSISLDSDWATDHCASDDFLREFGLWAGGAIYNNTSDEALPLALGRTHGAQDLDTIWQGFINDTSLIGERLISYLDTNVGSRLSLAFMANQVPQRTNRIQLHPTVTDKWGRKAAHILKGWHSHDIYLMNTLADQCDQVLRKGVGPEGSDFSHGAIWQASNAPARMANHILGGARFGTDQQDSVLDKDCRAWNFDNLYVTDGSFMPSSGGGNPTLTIQANSFRVADILLGRV
ncbi:GMC family oxidoreductase [Actinophytocola sp.]|uniref:GMC family oxidoreductase n=1 Tax=Actinophytocola sp. TaxID=1872138 RepID=UPI002ED50519